MVVAGKEFTHSYSAHDDGTLWSVPLGGGTPRRLASRASMNIVRLDENRLATALDPTIHGIVDVVLIDLEAGSEQLVDERVHAAYAPRLPLRPLGDDLYTYSVVDGERSGIWLVHLPPGS